MSKTETAGPVDLSAFDAAMDRQERGIEVPILDQAGKKKLGLTITVVGRDSRRAIAAQDEMTEELVEREIDSPLSAAERRDRGIRFLAKLSTGWTPNIILDGKELAFSEANAVKLYTRHPFIKEQVDVAVGSRSRFIES